MRSLRRTTVSFDAWQSDETSVHEQPKSTPKLSGRARFARRFDRHRWAARHQRAGKDGSAFTFGSRMFAAVAVAFALSAITSYFLLERNLVHQEIAGTTSIAAAPPNRASVSVVCAAVTLPERAAF